MGILNPYQEILERQELLRRFSPTVAGYLLSLKNLPQWVRGALPLSDLCKIARRQVSLPPGIIGVLGNPDVFACWCAVDNNELIAGLYCVRRSELAGSRQLLTAWDGSAKLWVILPELGAGVDVRLEVCDG